jgi:23S rRNA (uridine2552-2'-O)-methyltransferase
MKKTKRSKKSRSWVIKQHRDQFFKKSKVLGYRSRSAFKLIELNKKFKLINKSTNLLDLGASPGGWSQVASQIVKTGKILAIDIKSMENLNNVMFLQCNFTEDFAQDQIKKFFNGKIQIIISDLAANTTGNQDLDCIRTNSLCSEVINFSSKIIINKGKLLSKLFMGEDFIEVKNLAKSKFKKVEFFKPEASRNESRETYIYCEGLKTL